MTQNKEKKHNFIMQAGILAAAGIVVRIIGILYRSPLVAIIGDEGNGYYSTAYAIYTIILLVSSYSIPAAISKVIAARLSLGQFRNAHRLFVGAFAYVIVVGSIGSMVCFFFADRLVGASSAQVLKVFAPTIFLSGLLGTFRGYFQAQHTMVFTSFSQIFEQIINALVSIGAAYAFVTISINRGASDTVTAIGGAKGSAIGTGAGVLIALIYMLIVYLRRHKDIMEKVKADTTDEANLMGPVKIAATIFGMVTPVVLSTCIYNLSTASNLKIYQEIMMRQYGLSEALATTNYGLFSGKAMQIVNIPIAIASAMSAAIIPTIAHSYERGEYDEGRKKIAYAIKVTMLIAIPAAMGLIALAEPVTLLLYPQRASYQIVSSLIRVLAMTVVFYCLSTLSNAILQGTGNVNIPVINAAISLIIQASVLIILLKNTSLGLYALVIATIVYSFLMCILNGAAIKAKLYYKQEMVRSYILPLNASVWMFVVTIFTNWLVSFIIRTVFHNPEMVISGMLNVLRLAISLLIALVTYSLIILKTGAATTQDISMMPKGKTLIKILKKMHLVHEHDIVNRRRIKNGDEIITTDYKLSEDEISAIESRREKVTNRIKK